MSMFAVTGTKTGMVKDTTVQLYRNFQEFVFSPDASVQKQLADRVWSCIEGNPVIGHEFSLTQVPADSTAAARLSEQRVIPHAVAKSGGWLIASKDQSIAIVIGGADHLCIQVRGTGLCPGACLQSANQIAALISAGYPFAFDSDYGYLTASPSNLGTGLRVIASIHLPALTEKNLINQAVSYAARCGCQMKGLYSQEGKVLGKLYQVTNQTTLGISEAEIAEKLKNTVDNITESEQAARRQIREQDGIELQDRTARALGILKYSRLMTVEEALQYLSDVLVGLENESLAGVRPEEIYKMTDEILPVMLEGSTQKRQADRASALRELLKNVTEKI